ncbi:MAG: Npun_R2479 family HD domain-containing metalloprotein [Cyanobacteria bacterium P01_C01_bin.89]
MLFNSTDLLINAFVERLQDGYERTYGNWKSSYKDILAWAGGVALENIANGDALYHNVEHTIMVALVGQEVIRGKHIRDGGVAPDDWLHFIISLLFHDIGYIKGVCLNDGNGWYATGIDDERVRLPHGSTDASLTQYHVDRSKQFLEERFGGHKLIDVEILKRNVELTRFPVPDGEDRQDTRNYPGLVRASDLLGQLSDPRYLNKICALFYEFEETGMNEVLGYKNPGDLRNNYAQFFWKGVYPYVQDALEYLALTQAGKQVIANLYSNVFMVEHGPGLEFPVSVPQAPSASKPSMPEPPEVNSLKDAFPDKRMAV